MFDNTLLTNFRIEEYNNYKLGIEYMLKCTDIKLDIYIEDIATDFNNIRMEGYLSLHTNNRGDDHFPFWNIMKMVEDNNKKKRILRELKLKRILE
jgi:hypothetical protein